MGPRWDDPLHGAERPDDDDRRSEGAAEQGEDRDRAEGTLEKGDRPDAGDPDTRAETAGTLDRAEESAATADASLRERLLAGAQRGAGLVGAGFVGIGSFLGLQETDDRPLVQAVEKTAEAIGEAAAATQERKENEDAAEEPNRGVDPHEQLQPDRDGDHPPAEGLHADAADED
ncbi:hypothetical protein [Micromonospora sp. NPDC049497]|uniref:hypothetical protein n=1 Tax=Micromonospora sp. NPDC049497 TaxID=3364273 RepID=UPI00378DFCA5